MWAIIRDVPCAELGYRAIIDEDGYVVCDPSPMGEANARLIAAAPDLLAALERCVEALQRVQDASSASSKEVLDEAMRVIARAKGVVA